MCYSYSLNSRTGSGRGRIVRRRKDSANAYLRAMVLDGKLRVCIFADVNITEGQEILLDVGGKSQVC